MEEFDTCKCGNDKWHIASYSEGGREGGVFWCSYRMNIICTECGHENYYTTRLFSGDDRPKSIDPPKED